MPRFVSLLVLNFKGTTYRGSATKTGDDWINESNVYRLINNNVFDHAWYTEELLFNKNIYLYVSVAWY